MPTPPPSENWVQNSFRGRNDNGTLETATWKTDMNNENWEQDRDEIFRCRFLIMNVTIDTINNQRFRLHYSLNGSPYAVVDISTPIQLVNDTHGIQDGATTQQRIGTGMYTTGDSQGYNDGVDRIGTGVIDSDGADQHEQEYCLIVDSAQVQEEDCIELQVRLINGAQLNSYVNTPRIEFGDDPTRPPPPELSAPQTVEVSVVPVRTISMFFDRCLI